MPRAAATSLWIRALVAAVLALLIAVRLLSPPGFMPSFADGAVTIVSCPDYEPVQPTMGHHHGKPEHGHAPCPYAAAASLGALDLSTFDIAALLFAGAATRIGQPVARMTPGRRRERPPSQGPPIPA